MAVLPVIQDDEDRLRIVSQEVNPLCTTLGELVEDLVETMRAHHMASLSAVQCGIPLRIFVTEVMGSVLSWMNPVVLRQEGTQKSAESCASFPDMTLELERPLSMVIEVRTEQNSPEVREVSGILARLVAHELDHLDGKTAQDHLPEEEFYAQLIGTAFSNHDDLEDGPLSRDEGDLVPSDTRFDFLREFQNVLDSPDAAGDTHEVGDEISEVLDLMADGTWKWVLAVELLKDLVADDELAARFNEMEGTLTELAHHQDFWESVLQADADTSDGDDGDGEDLDEEEDLEEELDVEADLDEGDGLHETD